MLARIWLLLAPGNQASAYVAPCDQTHMKIVMMMMMMMMIVVMLMNRRMMILVPSGNDDSEFSDDDNDDDDDDDDDMMMMSMKIQSDDVNKDSSNHNHGTCSVNAS